MLMLAAGVGGQGERLAGRRKKMAVESRVTQEEIKKEPEKPIDREKVERGRLGVAVAPAMPRDARCVGKERCSCPAQFGGRGGPGRAEGR